MNIIRAINKRRREERIKKQIKKLKKELARKRERDREAKRRLGRIPMAPPTQTHKDKSKYSRKKKHREVEK